MDKDEFIKTLNCSVELGLFENPENYLNAFERAEKVLKYFKLSLLKLDNIIKQNYNYQKSALLFRIDTNSFLKIVVYSNDLDFEITSNPTNETISADLNDFYNYNEKYYPLTENLKFVVENEILVEQIKKGLSLTGNNIEELREDFLKNELNERTNFKDFEKNNCLFLLFKELETENKFYDEKNKNLNNYMICKILKIIEIDNIRFCIYSNKQERNDILVANPYCNFYNYLDEGRYFYMEYKKPDYFFDFDFDITIIDKIINKLNRGYFGNEILLSTKDVLKIINQEEQESKIEEKKEKEESELKHNLIKLFKKEGFVIMNGIKISKTGIMEYNDYKIGCEDFPINMENFENIFYTLKETDTFNHIFEKVLTDLVSRKLLNKSYNNSDNYFDLSKTTDNFELWVGKFKVKLSEKGSLVYIENKRINRGEIVEILARGLCFDNKEKYMELISEISKCSLKIHNLITNGILFDFREELTNQDITVRLNLIKKGKGCCIVLDNNQYAINNINGLNNSVIGGYRARNNFSKLIGVFSKNTEIQDEKIVISLLKEGVKGYKEAIRRSEELLQETINLLGIQQMKTTIDHQEENGYLIKGKLKEYFVTENLKIYEYPSLKYVCVIDKDRHDTIGKDRLVSRMYALSNDSLMIENISTLNR